jgi:hypothetical protein
MKPWPFAKIESVNRNLEELCDFANWDFLTILLT